MGDRMGWSTDQLLRSFISTCFDPAVNFMSSFGHFPMFHPRTNGVRSRDCQSGVIAFRLFFAMFFIFFLLCSVWRVSHR